MRRAGVIQARNRGDLGGAPGAADHQQTGFVALHGQELAGAVVRHHGAQPMFGFLQRSDFAQVVVGRRRGEIHFQMVRRQLRQHAAVFQLHRAIVLEMHDQGAIELAARRDAEFLAQRGGGADSLERHDFGAMHMAALANFIGDGADLEGVRARMPVGDEAAHPGNADQHSFIAQFLERAVGCHARHAEGFYDLVFGRDAGGSGPLARADVGQNMALHFQIKRLQ